VNASRSRPPASGWTPGARFLFPALLVVTALAYYPAWHGGVLWDDNAHLTRADLRSTAGLWRIWFDVGATQQYYPVSHSGFWLMHRLWGNATTGYHLVNIALHATSSFLLALILRRLAVRGAVLAAFIFALHPVQVESVAWMTELKNTLSGVCFFGAALAYLRFDRRRDLRAYAMSFLLFAGAVLAKSVTAVLPAASLVVFWWQRGVGWRRDVRPLIPFFAFGIAAGLMTAWFERTLNGAQGAEFQLTFADRAVLAGRAAWFYAAKLAWPIHLSFIYPRWTIDGHDWRQWIYPAAAALVVVACWSLRRRSRAPLAVVLLFLGLLFPALGFFDVYPFRYSFVADHFQYLASAVLISTFAASARRPDLVGPVIVALLAVLTWSQSREYKDEATLYAATLERNPECWLCHNNLATAKLHGSEAEFQDAVAHLHAALKVNPRDPEAHNNMGGALQRMGRYEDALREHEEALRLNPALVEARYNVGVCQQALGRIEQARAEYAEAVRVQPDYAMAHYNLGTALTQLGRLGEAEAEFNTAIRLAAEFAPAHDGLAVILLRTGRIPDAVTEFKTATRIRPDYAPSHYKLALTLANAGLNEEALDEFAQAVLYAPASPEMHHDYGVALANAGRLDDAAAQFSETLRLQPGNVSAKENLIRLKR
jgi:tetratricopeptide (TPR) repeat protein